MLKDWEPAIAEKIEANRGQVVASEPFAYLLGKRAVWVKRVELDLYKNADLSVFNIPHESGKPKDPFQKKLAVKPPKSESK